MRHVALKLMSCVLATSSPCTARATSAFPALRRRVCSSSWQRENAPARYPERSRQTHAQKEAQATNSTQGRDRGEHPSFPGGRGTLRAHDQRTRNTQQTTHKEEVKNEKDGLTHRSLSGGGGRRREPTRDTHPHTIRERRGLSDRPPTWVWSEPALCYSGLHRTNNILRVNINRTAQFRTAAATKLYTTTQPLTRPRKATRNTSGPYTYTNQLNLLCPPRQAWRQIPRPSMLLSRVPLLLVTYPSFFLARARQASLHTLTDACLCALLTYPSFFELGRAKPRADHLRQVILRQ